MKRASRSCNGIILGLVVLGLGGVGCGSGNSGRARDAGPDGGQGVVSLDAGLDGAANLPALDGGRLDAAVRLDAGVSEAGRPGQGMDGGAGPEVPTEVGPDVLPKPVPDAPLVGDAAMTTDVDAPALADIAVAVDTAVIVLAGKEAGPEVASLADTLIVVGADAAPDLGPDAPTHADIASDLATDAPTEPLPDATPAMLAVDHGAHEFPATQASGGTQSHTATFSNTGGLATGALTVALTSTAGYAITADTCSATSLQPGGTCTVTVQFAPTSTGTLTASLAVTGTPGGAATVSFTGMAGHLLRVVRGLGTTECPSCVVKSDVTSPAIDCGASGDGCSAVYPSGTVVSLTAQVQANGSGHWFTGLSGAGCSGLGRSCTVTLNASQTVTANYPELVNNLIFVSSETYAMILGTSYDARCNALASAVGINNAALDAYMAFLSFSSSPGGQVWDRLVLANHEVANWRRMDGAPVAGTPADWSIGKMYSDVRFDEHGQVVSGQDVATGTDPIWREYESCGGHTRSTGVTAVGSSTGGPDLYTLAHLRPCNSSYRVYCLMRTNSAPMSVGITGKVKRIWVSSATFTPSNNLLKTPDAVCGASLPTGVTSAKALLATTSASAGSLLGSMTTYVRPDGMAVGTGAQIAANQLKTGIWVDEAGQYATLYYYAWTGATSIDAVGTAESTCGNWANTGATAGQYGYAVDLPDRWWSQGAQACNSTETHLYCFEP